MHLPHTVQRGLRSPRHPKCGVHCLRFEEKATTTLEGKSSLTEVLRSLTWTFSTCTTSNSPPAHLKLCSIVRSHDRFFGAFSGSQKSRRT